MLINSSSRETNSSSVSGVTGLGPIDQTSSEFARKLRSTMFYLANPAPANRTNLQMHQRLVRGSGRTRYRRTVAHPYATTAQRAGVSVHARPCFLARWLVVALFCAPFSLFLLSFVLFSSSLPGLQRWCLRQAATQAVR